jgi:hypothetical protein
MGAGLRRPIATIAGSGEKLETDPGPVLVVMTSGAVKV